MMLGRIILIAALAGAGVVCFPDGLHVDEHLRVQIPSELLSSIIWQVPIPVLLIGRTLIAICYHVLFSQVGLPWAGARACLFQFANFAVSVAAYLFYKRLYVQRLAAAAAAKRCHGRQTCLPLSSRVPKLKEQ